MGSLVLAFAYLWAAGAVFALAVIGEIRWSIAIVWQAAAVFALFGARLSVKRAYWEGRMDEMASIVGSLLAPQQNDWWKRG